MSELHQTCLVCGSSYLAVKYQMNGFHLFACHECGLIFVGEKLSSAELRDYYEHEHDFTYDEAGQNAENLNFYYRTLATAISRRRAPGKILDVGCSSGLFLECMKGWDCYGVEIDVRYARKAQEKFGDHVRAGTLDGYAAPSQYFDVITLQDVLDHLPYPLTALEQCHRLLKPEGLLVIKVHDLGCFYARMMGKNFYAFIPPVHLVYFNKLNLTCALQRNGFHVQESCYLPQQIFLKTIFCRLSRNNQKSFWHAIYRGLDRSFLSKVRIRKNLRDIVTVIAEKRVAPAGVSVCD